MTRAQALEEPFYVHRPWLLLRVAHQSSWLRAFYAWSLLQTVSTGGCSASQQYA